ncbi:hypothetical protein GCM10010361_46590 [Streptomyces olivaceiscleroticus]|uniref:Uncharacterized protein n=1 Tax=Streptomyces olivaceiscleroticus TaxID=68245 RepID=A0ABP3KD22_9ACTN
MARRGFFSRHPVRGAGAGAPGIPGRGTVGAPGSGLIGPSGHGPAELLRSAPGRWAAALLLGGLWWWAVLRLFFWPEGAGVVEGAMAAGGWGLSLLPVHCVPRRTRPGGGRVGAGGWRRRSGCVGTPGPAAVTDRLVRAWRYRRWGGGTDRS